MIRFVVILLASILLITVVRAIVGVIMKGFADLVKGPDAAPPAGTAKRAEVPTGGELKRDPVCGTYVSTSTSLKKSVGGETLYFCSAECRDKHRA